MLGPIRKTPKAGHGQDVFEPTGFLKSLEPSGVGVLGYVRPGMKMAALGFGRGQTLKDLQFPSKEDIPFLALLESALSSSG